MSLFINSNSHPTLYKGNQSIKAPNQTMFKSDYLREILKEQLQLNHHVQQTMKGLKQSLQKHQLNEADRWKNVNRDIDLLKRKQEHQENFEIQAREWLEMLERNSHELHRLLEDSSMENKDILTEIKKLHQSNAIILEQLEKFDVTNEQLSNKMSDLANQQERVTEQISLQNNKQDQVLDQLENQEAMMEKSYRQVNNIRSILFERTSFITEKIEESYKLTTSMLYKLLTGSDKPLSLIMVKQKSETSKEE